MQEQRITTQGGNTPLARRLLNFVVKVDLVLFMFFICAAFNPNSGAGPVLLMLLMVGLLIGASWYALSQGLWFEWRKERIFNAVCAYLGYSDTRVTHRPVVTANNFIGVKDIKGTKMVYPQLRRVHGTDDNWEGLVRPFVGQTIRDYQDHTDRFATAFGVEDVDFEPDRETGFLRIIVGRQNIYR